VGFLDVLGGRRKLKQPAPDRLFAMTTAQVALETALDIKPAGVVGIVFQPLATADFKGIVSDAEELLRGTAEDSGTTVDSADDEFGYRWLVLRDPDFEDLVVALNTISTELQSGGYGDRLLACMFAFEDGDANDSASLPNRSGDANDSASLPNRSGGRRIYFIYNFKRGTFYPFVPTTGDKSRDTERELRLKAQLADELPIEPELDRWFPLWEIPL
jgi:hypothetical protein